jgi:hypothetical protein
MERKKVRMKKLSAIISFLAFSLLLANCSSFKRYDDAIRIKESKERKYSENPVTKTDRDGRTLRGTVVGLEVVKYPLKCPDDSTITEIIWENPFKDQTLWDGNHINILFLDSKSPEGSHNFEKIPLDDVELLRDLVKLPDNEYGNLNLVETFNKPLSPDNIRKVDINIIEVDTCRGNVAPCPCRPISLPEIPCLWCPICPDRVYSWYFLELRGGYSIFTDRKTETQYVGRDAFLTEIAAGFRLGSQNEWGIGLAFTYGIKTYNSFKQTDVSRPTLLLHGRYQTAKDILGLCMKPFIYGQIGIPVDELSLGMIKFDLSNECSDCRRYLKDLQASGQLPGVDFSWPISFGIGVGLDFHITSWLDLSFDIGLKSLAFGEELSIAGFDNVPSTRRITMLLFRFGLTF